MKRFSPSKRGFFDTAIHGENIPSDAVDITDSEYRSLLVAQSQGKVIQPDENGRPVAVDPPAPPAPTEEELAATARAERDRRMKELYDPAIMQLLRNHRAAVAAGAETTAIDASIEAWDAYAHALELVPDQPDFPHSVIWPDIPAQSN